MKRPRLSSAISLSSLSLLAVACGHTNGMNVSPLETADASPVDEASADAAIESGGLRIDVFDDFEDGDLDVNVAGGRFGHWYNYDDMTEGSNHIAAVTLDPTTERHTTLAGSSKMAMRVQSTGYTRWGSGFSADVAAAMPYDVSAYTGLVFWTKNLTTTPLKIKFALQDANSDPRAGRCDPAADAPMETACYDAFAQEVELLPGDWQIHMLPFWALRQGGWGLPVPTGLAKREVYALPVGEYFGTTYDYLLDDVGFYVE
jgi:hypothetical protein